MTLPVHSEGVALGEADLRQQREAEDDGEACKRWCGQPQHERIRPYPGLLEHGPVTYRYTYLSLRGVFFYRGSEGQAFRPVPRSHRALAPVSPCFGLSM